MRKFMLVLASTAVLSLAGCGSDKGDTRAELPATPGKQNSQNPTESNDTVKEQTPISFKKFGLIREFGGTDNTALFGLLPEAGKLQITTLTGPKFLDVYKVGELNKATLDKLFLNTKKPLNQSEREALLSDFNGATVLYTEGYHGNLCRQDETGYEIKATGKIDDVDVEVSFQFEALPNVNGSCTFHTFAVVAKYVK